MKSFQIKTPQQWTEDEDGAAAAADEEVEEASGPNQRARRDRPWKKVSIFRKLYISLGRRKHASPGRYTLLCCLRIPKWLIRAGQYN